MINLEPLAAKAAQRMVGANADSALNLINKALMVLAEQGLFAFGLFLCSRKRDEDIRAASDIHQAVIQLLETANLATRPQNDHIINVDYYRALTETRTTEQPAQALQRLILTKQVVETALTYGRYQAKSLS